MKLNKHLILVSLAISVLADGSKAADPEGFIYSKRGTISIILTAPHGGQEVLPKARPRTRGTTLTDAGTFELAESVAKHLAELLGVEPYIVAAKFHRRYVDANRAQADAFEDLEAKPVYLAYHGRVHDYVREVKQKYPNGALLLDIHGQSNDVNVIHRGTRNGSTVTQLIRRHGVAALTGPNSVLGHLQANLYTVFPPNTPLGNPPEDPRFNGGYTVETYSSRNPEGIDAIQLEIGRTIRARASFARDLAEAVAVFYRAYLAVVPPATLQAPNGHMTRHRLQFSANDKGCTIPSDR